MFYSWQQRRKDRHQGRSCWQFASEKGNGGIPHNAVNPSLYLNNSMKFQDLHNGITRKRFSLIAQLLTTTMFEQHIYEKVVTSRPKQMSVLESVLHETSAHKATADTAVALCQGLNWRRRKEIMMSHKNVLQLAFQ